MADDKGNDKSSSYYTSSYGNYEITSSGMNSQGNYYDHRDYGPNAPNPNSYHYSNRDGSYYYSNPNGSTYHNNGQGSSTYTSPSGDRYTKDSF